MSKSHDAMVLSQLWRELGWLCDKVGTDRPDLALLGQDSRKVAIPGFNLPLLS